VAASSEPIPPLLAGRLELNHVHGVHLAENRRNADALRSADTERK
jgi:hypothetical protein